ncbi:MAG TPA: hypothetical protein VGE02_01960 [Gemmatimonadales bacterium]
MSAFTSATARRIAFATCADLPGLTDDDRLGAAALESLGVQVVPAVWSDPAVEWGAFDSVVVRSCWDYFHRPDEFAAWIDAVDASGVPLRNPPALLRWNGDKRYLRDLADAGIAVPETVWVEDEVPSLVEVLSGRGWDEAVVKPVVSGGGFETWRVGARDATELQPRLAALAARGAVMVQRFLRGILADGEWSLVYFGGRFSHALVKRAREGEFRVQHMHGGTVTAAEAPEWLRAHGERVIAAAAECAGLGEPPLYARVDGVMAEDGDFLLMELECVEPDFFLRTDGGAAERFALAASSVASTATLQPLLAGELLKS